MPKKSKLSNRFKLAQAVLECKSQSEILVYFGLKPTGSNFLTLRRYAALYDLTLPKYVPVPPKQIKMQLASVLVENSSYNRCHLKKRLIDEGILAEVCDTCGLQARWNGRKLVLHLDHINGINNDNRMSNLRLLCPNCHSQTDTYGGRNLVPRERIELSTNEV